MRRSEITEKLIALSKKAKELGFPQDVEEGDYVCLETDEMNTYLLTAKQATIFPTREFLILTFSRCLSWLQERGWNAIQFGRRYDETQLEMSIFHDNFYEKKEQPKEMWKHLIETKAETHHEAIAKAVCQVLEEK